MREKPRHGRISSCSLPDKSSQRQENKSLDSLWQCRVILAALKTIRKHVQQMIQPVQDNIQLAQMIRVICNRTTPHSSVRFSAPIMHHLTHPSSTLIEFNPHKILTTSCSHSVSDCRNLGVTSLAEVLPNDPSQKLPFSFPNSVLSFSSHITLT